MIASPSDTSARRRAFRRMHDAGIFVIPNPWDVGSARYLQGLGFKALATTSAGLAWSSGQPDGVPRLEATLAHLRLLVGATELPVNADFESGFATDPQGVEEDVRRAVETGVAGLSIDDSTGELARPIFDIDDAVARLRAARRAIDRAGDEVVLVDAPRTSCSAERISPTRSRGCRRIRPPVPTASTRPACARASRSPRWSPRSRRNPSTCWWADSRRPPSWAIRLGVRRISVGGGLARAAWGGFMRSARALAEYGHFDQFEGAANGRELDTFFRFTRDASAPKLSGRVVGHVAYAEGDGPMIPIPVGPVAIVTTAADAVLSWNEDAAAEVAALPLADFCHYVASGAIVVSG